MVSDSETQAGVQLVSFKFAKGSVNVLGIGLQSAQRAEKTVQTATESQDKTQR
jgi:hypothetical protein